MRSTIAGRAPGTTSGTFVFTWAKAPSEPPATINPSVRTFLTVFHVIVPCPHSSRGLVSRICIEPPSTIGLQDLACCDVHTTATSRPRTRRVWRAASPQEEALPSVDRRFPARLLTRQRDAAVVLDAEDQAASAGELGARASRSRRRTRSPDRASLRSACRRRTPARASHPPVERCPAISSTRACKVRRVVEFELGCKAKTAGVHQATA